MSKRIPFTRTRLFAFAPAIFLVAGTFVLLLQAFANPPQGQALPLAKSAYLQLTIHGDERTPSVVSSENVWRWYALRTIFISVDKETGARHEQEVAILFISFEPPVRVGTLEVRGGEKLPRYEVKEFNNRFAIIYFSAPPPAGPLEVFVKP